MDQNTENQNNNIENTRPEKFPTNPNLIPENNGKNSIPISIEMKRSFIDYAMSVIVDRALPDCRDGLKPVHRRILYAMYELGVTHQAKYKKCANVVGEVMGKYHPHGDVAIYDSLVRMAQDFSMRYPLINGQGNFGSIDGDPPAAMRYTECRMHKIAQEILKDIEKQTVDFIDNYDASRKEPLVLPANLPNLLLNGSTGIAVGMATNIPPHNLNETLDALNHIISNSQIKVEPSIDKTKADAEAVLVPIEEQNIHKEIKCDLTTENLLEYIQGPDFPTGGIIYDWKEIVNAYATGRGKVVTRAKTEIEEMKGGRYRILITEIPYQINKTALIEKIADLVRNKKLEGIGALRDESDRKGMQIVVELKKESNPQKILNRLYKYTSLQSTFNLNMVALVKGEPKLLNLKQLLFEFVNHRLEIVIRRTQFELKQTKARAHILEGLKIALDHLDAVIKTIRESQSQDDAKNNLMSRFALTEIQAQAILDMQLRRLAALERQKIEDEYKATLDQITYLMDLLSHPEKFLSMIKKEFTQLKEQYGDARKTKLIKGKVGEFSEEDLITNEQTIVIMTKSGYIKRAGLDTYKSQHRGGKGVIGMTTKEDDEIDKILSAETHDTMLFFTNRGRVFAKRVFDIPEAKRQAKGQAVINFIEIESEEKVTSILTLEKNLGQSVSKYLFMATKGGFVKKTAFSEFENIRRSGLIAIRLEEHDTLEWVKPTTGHDEMLLITRKGKSIRFKETDVRETGRATRGVRGIKLGVADQIVGMEVVPQKGSLLIIMQNGYGKRTDLNAWRVQGRGGMGIKAAHVTAKTGEIIDCRLIIDPKSSQDLLIISKEAQVIRMPFKDIPLLGRDTQGVRLMKLNANDCVASLAMIEKEEK